MNAVATLISLAVVLQTIENLWIVRILHLEDPWADRTETLGTALYPALLGLRLLTALSALVHPSAAAFAILWLTTGIVAWRFRGSFNGSSDGMTFHVVGATLVALLAPRLETAVCLYIAILSCLSYFFAGLSKLRQPEWWNGEGLSHFLKFGNSAHAGRGTVWLAEQPTLLRVASWSVLTFEILFPLSLFNSDAAALFLTAGTVFHLGNYYLFGLNRFFFAWLATYPAIYWVATHS